MTRRHGIALTVLAAVAALGSAGSAFAAYVPRFVVTPGSLAAGGAGPVKIRFTAPQADEPTAKATVYVPVGYRSTTAGRPGTRLGTAAASFHSVDLGAVVPVTGPIEVANAVDFSTQAAACTGTANHAATWVLRFASAGTALPVPVFVDPVPGSLASLAVRAAHDLPVAPRRARRDAWPRTARCEAPDRRADDERDPEPNGEGRVPLARARRSLHARRRDAERRRLGRVAVARHAPDRGDAEGQGAEAREEGLRERDLRRGSAGEPEGDPERTRRRAARHDGGRCEALPLAEDGHGRRDSPARS